MQKLILVLIIVIIAGSNQAAQVQCPWSDDGKTRLVYNGHECVEPLTQDTQPSQKSADSPPYETDVSAFKCPQTDGYFRCPESQSKYYSCENGVPSLETCPRNTVFDGNDACIKQRSRSFRCPKSKGKFRVPRSTNNQYYQCYRNRPRLRTCPQYQYFNGRECLEVRARPQRQELFQCPAENGVFPDQRDQCCFWVCRDRAPTRGRCPPRQCGCVNTWHQVSGVIIHQENPSGNQVIDTWNTQTHQWDRSFRHVHDGQTGRRVEHRYYEPKFVYTDGQRNSHQGVPGYPVDEARVQAENMLDDDYYYYK